MERMWSRFSFVLFSLFALLCLRFLLVYLAAVPAELMWAGLGGGLALGAAVCLRPGPVLLVFAALSPAAVGLQNSLGLQAAPVLEFGFAWIFLFWWLGKGLYLRVDPAPRTDAAYLADILILLVMISLIMSLVVYPLDFLVQRLQYPTVSGIEDPFWPLEASLVLLQGLFLFRLLLIEYAGHQGYQLLLRRVVVIQTLALVGFAGWDIALDLLAGKGLDRVRPLLPFTNPNPVGHYVVFFVAFWLPYAFAKLSRHSMVPLILLGATAFVALAAKSGTAWMAALAVTAGFVFSRLRRSYQVGACILLLTALGGLNIAGDSLQQSSNRYLRELADLTVWTDAARKKKLEFRKTLWTNAVHVLEEYPVTGCGVGSYFRISTYYQTEEERERIGTSRSMHQRGNRTNAHNYYLQLGAELGLSGLCLWLGILGLVFWAGLRGAHKGSLGDRERQALLLGLTALLLTGLTDHSLRPSAHQVLFWCAMSSVLILTFPPRRIFTPANRNRVLAAALVLGLVLIWGYTSKLGGEHPEIYEYGYYSPGETVQGDVMRWMMSRSVTEIEAESDYVGLSLYAAPKHIQNQTIQARMYFNGTLVDTLTWNEASIKHRYYHIPGLCGQTLRIRIHADSSYNPYAQGLTQDLRKNRVQSIAVGDIVSLQIPLDPKEVTKCVELEP